MPLQRVRSQKVEPATQWLAGQRRYVGMHPSANLCPSHHLAMRFQVLYD